MKDTTIGRAPTAAEKVLETSFAQYLADAAQSYQEPLAIKYTTPEDPDNLSSSSCRTIVLPSDAAKSPPQDCKIFEIHVTSPAFFSRLVQYRSLLTGLELETQDPSEENRTAKVSDPAQLYLLFAGYMKNKIPKTTIDSNAVPLSTKIIIRALRYFSTDRPTVAASYPIVREGHTSTDLSCDEGERAKSQPNQNQQPCIELQTKENADISFQDLVVARSVSILSSAAKQSRAEVLAALKVVLAARFALGNESLLDFYPWLGVMFALSFMAWIALPWFNGVLRLQT